MAVVKLSPFATGLSGVMKNLSFSTDGSTVSMKERETPANPKSAKQTANRSNFSLSSKGYSDLSPANLILWKQWAKLQTFVSKKGKMPYTPNSFEAYKSLTQVWYAVHGGSGTAPVAPPTASYKGSSLKLSAVAASGAITVSAEDSTPAGSVVEIGVQPLRNANRTPSENGYRIAAYHAFDDDHLTFSVPVGPGVHCLRYRYIEVATGLRTEYVAISVSGVSLALADGGMPEAGAKPAARRKAA